MSGQPAAGSRVLLTTANSVEGHRVTAHLELVRGTVVRSPGFARGLVGGRKSLFDGNIAQFEEIREDARKQAIERMLDQAADLGADVVLAMSYDATDFSQGVTEVLAYGTAVKLAPA